MQLLVSKLVVNPELLHKLVRVHGRKRNEQISLIGQVIDVGVSSLQVAHLSSNKTTWFDVSDFESKRLAIAVYAEEGNVAINLPDQQAE